MLWQLAPDAAFITMELLLNSMTHMLDASGSFYDAGNICLVMIIVTIVCGSVYTFVIVSIKFCRVL